MRRTVLFAGAAFLLATLAGCAAVQSTEQVVSRYNQAFANSRNEMLVLNVLRSAAREPLQFSTMGNVTGQVGNGGQITIPFTNLIGGGATVVSPSLQITDAVNPTITIVPLGAREFANAVLTPIDAEAIQLFLHSGWDAEFLLPLIVGGVVCPDGRLLLNSGEYEDEEGNQAVSAAFRTFFRDSAPTFRVSSTFDGESPPQLFTVSDEQALALLRDGVGPGRVIAAVRDQGPGMKQIEIRRARRTAVGGLRIAELCQALRGAGEAARPSLETASAAGGGGVMLRSVETIIYYLGESHRTRMRTGDAHGLTYFAQGGAQPQILFRLEWGPSGGPAAVETRFHDTRFFIRRLDLRRAEDPAGRDRTLKTLAFLDELIALKTNDNAIRGAQPILALPQ